MNFPAEEIAHGPTCPLSSRLQVIVLQDQIARGPARPRTNLPADQAARDKVSPHFSRLGSAFWLNQYFQHYQCNLVKAYQCILAYLVVPLTLCSNLSLALKHRPRASGINSCAMRSIGLISDFASKSTAATRSKLKAHTTKMQDCKKSF